MKGKRSSGTPLHWVCDHQVSSLPAAETRDNFPLSSSPGLTLRVATSRSQAGVRREGVYVSEETPFGVFLL